MSLFMGLFFPPDTFHFSSSCKKEKVRECRGWQQVDFVVEV